MIGRDCDFNPMSWNWWAHTDSGLLARVAIGAMFFVFLATVDLLRRGRKATRWREYLFLLACAAAAMGYGWVNDRIASSISWEYFYYGKGLDQRLGSRVPPDMRALQWEACKIGLKATWSVGLVVGVALLIANNPRKGRPQLPWTELGRMVVVVFVTCALFAAVGAGMGSRGLLNWTSHDISALWRDDLFRPRQFSTAYGMNLGGYVGGVVGTILVTARIVRRRSLRSKPI